MKTGSFAAVGGGLAITLLALSLLAGCATGPTSEMPAAAVAAPQTAAAPVDEPDPPPPLEKHEVTARCWMKVDRSRADIDTRTKLVDKCVAENMAKGKK